MPPSDDQAPATKKDLHDLAQTTKKDLHPLKKDVSALKKDVGDLKKDVRALKQDMQDTKKSNQQDQRYFLQTIMMAMQSMEDRTDAKIQEMENRILTVFEDFRHDVAGMLKDLRSNDSKVDDHEHRIRRLEDHAGMAA